MKQRMLALAAAMAMAAAAILAADVACPVTSQAPVLDGSLDDAAWQKAAVLTNFTIVGTTNTTDTTECRLLMDNAWLYFGFRCKNPGIQQMDQKEKERDGRVSADDSVEVFFDPGSGGALFFQFTLSYANVQAERMSTQKDGMTASWDLPWRSATKVEQMKDGWTAEMAIPLCLIASHGDPSKVRLNVARNERRIILDPYGARMNEEKTFSSWSPVLKTYAEPDKFRPLTGFEGGKIEIPELVALEGAEVGGYEMIGDKRGYTVKACLRSYTGKGGKAVIEVRDCPLPDGKGEVVKEEVAVKPMQSEEWTVHVPVTSLRQRDTVVTLKEAGSGAVLRELTIKAAAILNLMGETVMDRNYYTTENEARLRVRIGLPETELKDKILTVKLADGKALARTKTSLRDVDCAIALKDVPLGENPLTVALEDGEGKVIVEGKTTLARLAPRPGCEVKVDRFNKVLLKEGKPIFPFGLIRYVTCNRPDSTFQEAAAAGHTAIWRHWSKDRTEFTSLTQFMAMAQSHGLDVVDKTEEVLNAHLPKQLGNPGNIIPKDAAHQKELMEILAQGIKAAQPAMERHIRDIMDCNNLLGYFCGHEPNLINVQARMGKARAEYEVAHKTDPYRPVFAVFAREIPPGGLEVCDVAMYDVYNYPGWANQFYGRPSYVSDQMLRLKQKADSMSKVAMMMPMTEGLDVKRCWRLMLPGEQRCQTYLAVIHGSKGLFYFVDSSFYTHNMWNTLADLAKQMKVLGPAVTSGEVHPAARYAPVDMNAAKGAYPDVQATLFKNPAGGYILMAANAVYHPVDVKFTVPGLNAKAGIKTLFSDRKIAAEGEGFRDAFEPLGTRAYALELAPDAVKPVALALDMTAHPEQAMALKFFNPAEEFKNRKNCAANPSFEDISVPGLPDHVRPLMQPWPLIGAPGAVGLTLDPVNPAHGKVSLRETIPLPAAVGGHGIMGMCYIPNKPAHVVFSVYVKASANVKQAHVSIPGMVFEESARNNEKLKQSSSIKIFTPTTEWQRFTFKGMIDPARLAYPPSRRAPLADISYSIGPGNMGNVNVKDQDKPEVVEFWVDAVQMELGEQATEFTTE